MSFFQNFDIATCFEDIMRLELGNGDTLLTNKKKLGGFADSRIHSLRYMAYEAFFLTAQLEFRNGSYHLKSYIQPKEIHRLAQTTWGVLDRIEENRKKYPSLRRYHKRKKIGSHRLIMEHELLHAFIGDNPAADPEEYARFLAGFDNSLPPVAAFGAVALILFDNVVRFSLNNDIAKAFDGLYRAQFLIDAGKAILATASGKEYIRSKAGQIAKSGGEARSLKYKSLEQETIRLYVAGEWESVPSAAQAITPQIVRMSKNGNGDLLPTTTKPLQWIRAFNRARNSSVS